jgi:ubiquinone/menaquinone biosynthesis C-methylase UbiE
LDVRGFYDALAPWYHLVYRDWEASVAQQGQALASLLASEGSSPSQNVLDAAVGIGTQALGLATRGFRVTGSDISPVAVHRAGNEAARLGIQLRLVIADVRALPVRSATFDAVIACDNALPHLLSEREIHQALRECLRCLRPNGRCVISMRDYEAPPPSGTVETRDYGDRVWSGRACRLAQIWRWHGAFYDVAFELVTTDSAKEVVARTPPTTYFAIRTERVVMLMERAGFTRVRRIDGCLFQPVLVGVR